MNWQLNRCGLIAALSCSVLVCSSLPVADFGEGNIVEYPDEDYLNIDAPEVQAVSWLVEDKGDDSSPYRVERTKELEPAAKKVWNGYDNELWKELNIVPYYSFEKYKNPFLYPSAKNYY